MKLSDDSVDVGRQLRERCAIRFGTRSNHDVRPETKWENARPRQLAESALQSVSSDRGLTMPRYDQSDPAVFFHRSRTHERGSRHPNLEHAGSETFPLLRDSMQVRASGDSRASRECVRRSRRVRLLRICPGCEPSTACAPSCGGERGSYDPIWFPCAHEIRAS
jgi:hypothetical protein